MEGLFREEVLQAKRSRTLGTISLATPLSFFWWTLLATALAAAIILFLVFGHYTRRETVSGKLLSSTGFFTLSAQATGIVSRVLVYEGERVKAGEPLVEVSVGPVSASMGTTHAGLKEDIGDPRSRIEMLQIQARQIDGQLAIQRKQMDLMRNLVHMAEPLHLRGIISNAEFDQYESNEIMQALESKTLDRLRLDIERQVSTLRSQLAGSPLNTPAKANQTLEQRHSAQLAQRDVATATVLRAPSAGVISALLTKPGQSIANGQSLLTMIPRGSKLEAQLLVPPSAIGFVRPGCRVALRFRALPYQEFGEQYGKVVHVSQSAVTTAPKSPTGQKQEVATPLYQVLVVLEHQSIDAYGGRVVALKPGMALSADILIGRASLWVWAFAPSHVLHQQLSTGKGRAG